MIKSYRGNSPVIHEDAYVSETAVIIGKVTLKKNANVWFGSVLRGDMENITIGENTNIQENSVVHVDNTEKVSIGDNCTIGHNAIIHGCTIGDNTLIGMGAIILNGAKIGNNSIVAAGALVTQNKEFEDGMLILGNPAKAVRKLTKEEIEKNSKSSLNYVKLSKEME
ncbi:gamma carbonic anhydrase family protein [uncultured Clostridium sp.]|uniref:gamma carbonic anhydrase family protein n=1 Tax=uncultured Clostridium sp. TaxID=59620 RepID=UPI0025D96A77|nr:gamma carbonic anhydrase family protein [uncultured Clostridium sp.]